MSVRHDVLTVREREILGLRRDGFALKEIVGVLGITENTVKCHLSSLLHKLHARSSMEAVMSTLDCPHCGRHVRLRRP